MLDATLQCVKRISAATPRYPGYQSRKVGTVTMLRILPTMGFSRSEVCHSWVVSDPRHLGGQWRSGMFELKPHSDGAASIVAHIRRVLRICTVLRALRRILRYLTGAGSMPVLCRRFLANTCENHSHYCLRCCSCAQPLGAIRIWYLAIMTALGPPCRR